MQTPVQFFAEHAGFSHDPQTETPEQGRARGAARLANAEAWARDSGCSFAWEIDPYVDSSDHETEDDGPPHALWMCVMRDAEGAVIGSLGGVDFGRDVEPWGDPYRRVCEAETACEAMPD